MLSRIYHRSSMQPQGRTTQIVQIIKPKNPTEMQSISIKARLLKAMRKAMPSTVAKWYSMSLSPSTQHSLTKRQTIACVVRRSLYVVGPGSKGNRTELKSNEPNQRLFRHACCVNDVTEGSSCKCLLFFYCNPCFHYEPCQRNGLCIIGGCLRSCFMSATSKHFSMHIMLLPAKDGFNATKLLLSKMCAPFCNVALALS